MDRNFPPKLKQNSGTGMQGCQKGAAGDPTSGGLVLERGMRKAVHYAFISQHKWKLKQRQETKPGGGRKGRSPGVDIPCGAPAQHAGECR